MGFPFVLSTPIYRSIDIFAGEMNMATPTGKAGEILDSAERQARRRGYNGFSFRDLAADVGIKSASVHYHFPTKAELGAAVAQRYSERFMAHLGDPADPEVAPDALLERYVAAFRRALVRDRQMCLCGLLGAEVESLPPKVAAEVRRFFEQNVAWLAAVLSRPNRGAPGNEPAEARALAILALLEGALVVARTLKRDAVFDQIAGTVTSFAAPDG
jgi:TetR/AcrR family transcriptional repressor of nem operon